MGTILDAAVAALGAKVAGRPFDGTALFVLTGEGSIHMDGSTVAAGEGPADVTLTASPETFQGILAGDLDATSAFMTGRLKVDGDMPQHGHGLPTRPRVTRNLGNGDYQIEGVKFQMGGATPLTPLTVRVLRFWTAERGGTPTDPLFPTVTGRRLSPDAVEHRLTRHLIPASAACATHTCVCQ